MKKHENMFRSLREIKEKVKILHSFWHFHGDDLHDLI